MAAVIPAQIRQVPDQRVLGNVSGATGAGQSLTQAQVRTLLGLDTAAYQPASAFQPVDADLTAIAALSTTSFGRSFLTLADQTTARTYIGAGTSSFSGSFGDLSGVPTTISGYGITNAYTKTEVDNLVAGLLDFKGNQDCSANPNYPSASKGDSYYASVAGKIGGASGKSVEVGDLIVASADNAGGTEASVGTSWFVLEHNLTGALVASNNLSDLTSASTARSNLELGSLATQNGTISDYLTTASAALTYQPLDGDLTAIAALTTTTYGRSLLTGADAAATRTTLGLGTLATQSGTFSGTSSGTNTGDQTITLTGDVTGSGTGSFATTIANSAVTNTMLAGSIEISKLAITGTPDGSKFLRDDGTWAAASGGGGGITSLGGQTGATQTFLAATTGTDFAISSSGDVHTFAIPDASASARGLVTTGTQTIAGQKTFAQGTLTSSAPLTLTQTWNSGATTFTGMLLNVTDTASASASNLLVLQKSGSDRLTVTKNGVATLTFDAGVTSNALFIKGTDGVTYLTLGYPGSVYGTSSLVGFDVNGGVGKVNVGAGQMHLTYSGNTSLIKTYGNLQINPGVLGGGGNTVEILNGTTAQTFNISNTYTSSTNFEYGRFQWASNEFRIGTAVGSAGGTQRNLVLGSWNTAGTWTAWQSFASTSGVMTSVTFDGGANNYSAIRMQNSAHNAYIAVCQTGQADSILIGTEGAAAGNSNSVNGAIATSRSGSGLGVYTGTVGTRKWFWDSSGNVTATPVAATSGSQTGFTFTAPAPTGQTASTEATMVNWNLASTVTFAAGALTTQRAFRIQAPTYAFASASTITTASTLAISGAPAAGTNATITNAYALNVESGDSKFVGIVTNTAGTGVSNGRIAFGNDALGGSGAGMYLQGNYTIGIRVLGDANPRLMLDAGSVNSFVMQGQGGVAWSSGTTNASATVDLALYRDAAGTLAQRVGTAAQTFRVYNTYTSSTSHEYLKFSWATNVAEIGTVKGSGGGSARDLVIKTDDTERLRFASTGLMTHPDAHDIAFGSTTGTKIGTATTQKLGFWNTTPIVQPTTGVAAATRTGGGGTALTDTDTYDGYTIAQVVKALRNMGALA